MKQTCVLLVDDDPALLQALPQAIKLRLGDDFMVQTCDSAFEALTLIEMQEYDAIVTDIKMPGMDGLVLLGEIQKRRPQTPTLLITGHGDHNLAVQALRGGAYDFIQKPIDRDYFMAALSRAIQVKQLHTQVKQQQQLLQDKAAMLEHLVEERTRELVAAQAAKDEFLSVVSHELKTPLTTLKGMIQLLVRRQRASTEREEGVEVTARELHHMELSVKRMEGLVRDLLTTSLVETGFFALRKEHYDLGQLTREVVQEYLGERQSRVQVHREDDSLEVEMDVERVSQVLLNLLSNAHKYSPKDTPIVVTVKRVGTMGVINVQDRGTGIPPEQLEHIFERFYRVPGIAVQSGSSIGVGLGLYIAQKIMVLHEGHIEVASSPGEGSTFSLLLPLASSSVSLVGNEETHTAGS